MITHEFEPWVERYRPSNLDDVIGHCDVIATLRKFTSAGTLPHLLLQGPPGVGKTTIAKALTRELFGEGVRGRVLELNASDERGINTIRTSIKDFVGAGALQISGDGTASASRLKVVILDEADAMTSAAQNALRRIIEDNSERVRFLILCNNISGIIPALQSRCTKFRMPPLVMTDQLKDRLRHIGEKERLRPLTEELVTVLFELGGGDLRKIINLLQASAMVAGVAKEGMGDENEELGSRGFGSGSEMLERFGKASEEIVDSLFRSLLTDNLQATTSALDKLITHRGYDLTDIITGLHKKITSEVEFPMAAISILVARLATIERSVGNGADVYLQCCALAAAFYEARIVMT